MKKKILVCDDDIFIRILVRKVFEKLDFNVIEAEDGREGLKVAIDQRPSLIIMDYSMPVMDGYEAIINIRENELISGTPVIFLTGLNIEPSLKEKLKEKVVDYLVKPFRKEELISAAAKVIDLNYERPGGKEES